MAIQNNDGSQLPVGNDRDGISANEANFISDSLAFEVRCLQEETRQAEIARLSVAPLLLNQYLNERPDWGRAAASPAQNLRLGGMLVGAVCRHRDDVSVDRHPGNLVNRFAILGADTWSSGAPQRFTPRADDVALAFTGNSDERELRDYERNEGHHAIGTAACAGVALLVILVTLVFGSAIN